MQIGSEAHKTLFCQCFMDSYLDYEPEKLPWPNLDQATLDRLRQIPFWEEALDTERKAGVMVRAYAATIEDPEVRTAVLLQAKEEARHAQLLQFMVQHYGIPAKLRPAAQLPTAIDLAFTDFGYEECLDSFFGFGLFGIARESGFFPESLLAVFDPLLDEEARHIVFFVNWIAYQQINQGQRIKPLRDVKALWHYGRALRRLITAFGGSATRDGAGFIASGASAVVADLTPARFIAACLRENDYRMGKFDGRLLRPQLMPMLASLGLKGLQVFPQRQSRPTSVAPLTTANQN
jgi:hypothetical protein